ncbi:hypothetical protein [Xenorhabdus hominickii]|uniref:Uncharacterized protein n=1 Tax=Xenorhabdus hominickii TaxID=351679 RepID=A0A2G0PW75_XENHO|nr:hypothetical protein [Xenorhabdus hominickii]AOM40012.1 hypothetical protein A9255_05135 [Xenorhabdus hominickii]PHM51205.1 hypothetical protein Xhom_04964 [Xenorhabdus hominickii]
MMMILIKEDGSASITADGYSAWYDKEGKQKMAIGEKAPPKLCIYDESKQKVEKEQASKTYDAGMTLAVDAGAKVEITADSFKIRDSEGKVRAVIKPLDLKSAGIDSAKITKASHGDHLRQLVREEIRQFVNRESRCGGLFSTW